MIAGCEAVAEMRRFPSTTFNRLTGSDPSVTDYVVECPSDACSVVGDYMFDDHVERVRHYVKVYVGLHCNQELA